MFILIVKTSIQCEEHQVIPKLLDEICMIVCRCTGNRIIESALMSEAVLPLLRMQEAIRSGTARP